MARNICIVDNCSKIAHGLGFCSMHYRRYKLYGDPLNGKRLPYNGRFKLPEYKIWCKMKERCENPNCIDYQNYGGRGITILDGWENSFDKFYADMGQRPSADYEIDRIDNDGNYSKDNCRWVTKTTNRRNKRTTLTKEEVKFVRQLLAKQMMNIDIEHKTGISKDVVCNIKRGKSYKNYGVS